jgi:hypothetical protein
MARKLCIALQTPSIELVVKAVDAADTAASILVGFKRFAAKEAQEQLKQYDIISSSDSSDEEKATALENFIKSHILYIKNASASVYDGETLVEEIKISDTRTPPEFKDFWNDSKECLSVLVDNYLSSPPWKSPLYKAHSKALLNIDYEKEALKN